MLYNVQILARSYTGNMEATANQISGVSAGKRTVIHSHLKDMAIDALELSASRDQATVAQSLGYVLSSFDAQPEMAQILASMVTAAYSLAQDCPDERLLYQAYSCFSDEQLSRIIGLARSC
jgi:Tfp pilus assembly protein PilO